MKQIDSEYIEDFITHMLTMPYAHMTPNESELICRCPICGDSRHDRTKTSFYLNIDPNSDRYLQYICFRADCGAHGVVNSEFFDTIGYHNSEAIRNITKCLYSKSNGTYSVKIYHHKELSNIVNTDDKLSKVKLKYFNDRLGLNLDLKDLYNLKINLNLLELLRVNNIDIQPKQIRYYSQLSDYGLSFISADNSYAIIRDVSRDNKLGRRYTNINLFNDENSTKHYCIPTKLDILSSEPTVINIAEGAFDIIGVYYHLSKLNEKYNNKLYLAACGGASINSIIKYYIKTYGLIDCKINIFSDADVDVSNYKELTKLRPYLESFDVTIYYNSIGKDFGVPADQIKVTKVKL